MTDSTVAKPRDMSRVDVSLESDLIFWARRWGVEPVAVRSAVSLAGDIVTDVERELGRLPRFGDFKEGMPGSNNCHGGSKPQA